MKPKLMVCGYGRHGKDTVCEILRDNHGYTFKSSSMSALDAAIWPIMKGYYATKDECYEDRGNWRVLWYELIRRYNHNDLSRLARIVYSDFDIYCGIRSAAEFATVESQCLFKYSVWVDASDRKPPEGIGSMTVTQSMCDYTIYNNGTIDDLERRVKEFVERIERGT